jgi:KDO2-lipid IV(A) lauroyltransferase
VPLIKAVKARDYLAPRYWPTWLSLGVMRLVARLPLPVLVFIGKLFSQLLYVALPKRRAIAAINLRIAFPNFDDDDIKRLTRLTVENSAIAPFEMGLAWWESEKLLSMCEIEGMEHLQQALSHNKGVIILTAHFTCLEIGASVLSHHVPFQAMYKRAHNDLFDAFMKYHRGRLFKAIVDHHKPLILIKGLKKGYAAWYAPDQDVSGKDSVFIPFFGVDATALTAPARMAKISGSPVVPYYIQRNKNNRGYKLVLLPALENFPTGDARNDAICINQTLEHLIMQNPEQYLWAHKRYKNRPQGAEPIYPSKRS